MLHDPRAAPHTCHTCRSLRSYLPWPLPLCLLMPTASGGPSPSPGCTWSITIGTATPPSRGAVSAAAHNPPGPATTHALTSS